MKVQNILRISLVTVALAAALLLTGTTKAQEITNSDWPDTQNATMSSSASVVAAAPVANNTSAATVSSNAAASHAPAAVEQASLVDRPAILPAAFVLFSTIALALYVRSEAKRLTASSRGPANSALPESPLAG